MVQFAYVDVYYGIGWKKKYHAPTDHGFALKVRLMKVFEPFINWNKIFFSHV
jgi:hypothetical protein